MCYFLSSHECLNEAMRHSKLGLHLPAVLTCGIIRSTRLDAEGSPSCDFDTAARDASVGGEDAADAAQPALPHASQAAAAACTSAAAARRATGIGAGTGVEALAEGHGGAIQAGMFRGTHEVLLPLPHLTSQDRREA